MPPRPLVYLRSILRPRKPWMRHTYFRSFPLQQRTPHSAFHNTATLSSDSTPTHYETLNLTANASPADIKRQFYALSKKHHPDRNPDDPAATTRFVAISEAYHTLSVPEKRAQYDGQLQSSQAQGSGWGGGAGNYPQGSHSSASFGARPASGLNKKRSTFRGPPPSFYKSGGYGQHGAKRAEYAYQSANTQGEAGPESYGDLGGFGPGQQKQGHEVPHFDDLRHKETHDNVYQHIRSRRRRTTRTVRVEEDYDKGGMLLNFVLVSGVIAVIGTIATVFGETDHTRTLKKREQDLSR